MAVFKGKKTSNDIKNNGTISEDEVVASDVFPRYSFLLNCQAHSPSCVVAAAAVDVVDDAWAA